MTHMFNPIIPNVDLDVHEDPPGLWSRVAVICRWKDARAVRKRWPHAAVIGPLRTIRGIDELIRNVLHNQQIRLLVIAGSDLTPNYETTTALLSVWQGLPGWEDHIHPELREHLWDLLVETRLVDASLFDVGPVESIFEGLRLQDEDRSTGVTIAPRPPSAQAPAPHGDPGDRVAADTLGDLWPLVLRQAMRFGRTVPTQHGNTREYMNLVAVVRDPTRTMVEIEAGHDRNTAGPRPLHPVLLIDSAKAEAYYRRVTEPEIPDGAPYSYGSRLHGTCSVCRGDGVVESDHGTERCMACFRPKTDQIDQIGHLLREKPDTRAAFLTPWDPEFDSGQESGRPCLVGAWFRVVQTPVDEAAVVDFVWAGDQCLTAPTHAPGTPTGPQRLRGLSENNYGLCGAEGAPTVQGDPTRKVTCRDCLVRLSKQLHLTVVFRSHDAYGAYAHNLAGICLWLIRTAQDQQMSVGTVTCISMSAHIYERDWNDAEATIKKHVDEARHVIQWDRRSTWHVELIPVGEDEDGDEHHRFRATALTPDGRSVVATFEASAAEGLRHQIEKTGLVTSVGGALWLGSEIERVGREGG